MTGESLEMIKNSPFMEKLESDGYEVVMMSEAIDEYLMTNILIITNNSSLFY